MCRKKKAWENGWVMTQASLSSPLAPVPPDTRIAIVRSSYYPDLLSSMEETARSTLQEGGVRLENIQSIRAPGAFEIPLLCKTLAATGSVHGFLALGVIVQGETHHAGEIARACTDGLIQVQLEYGLPISHGVLFVDTLQHAKDRCLGRGNKGIEVARSLLQMLSVIQTVTTSY
jgi:6,7-dimethyl-8-ribityllumazine synthase